MRLNGKRMESSSQLRNAIASTKPGSTVELEVFRDGRLQTFRVKVGLLDDKLVATGGSPSATASATELGMTVQTLTAQMAEQMGYSDGQKGVVVTSVDPGSAAASAGIRPQDVIVSVNGDEVTDAASFRRLVKKHDASKGLRLQVRTDGFSRFVFLKTK